MAKRSATKDTEALLGKLVTKVSPAELRIHLPRFAVIGKRASYEITATTRGVTISWSGDTLAEAAQEGLEYLGTPAEDPWRTCWKRTTRIQREFVRAILRGHAAEQIAKATAAKIAGEQTQAHVAFELADALHAAIDEIDHEDFDENGAIPPEDSLSAEAPCSRPIMPRATTK